MKVVDAQFSGQGDDFTISGTIQSTDDTRLLPCPFCGSSKLLAYQDEWGCAEVECDDCKCQGPFVPHEKGMSEEAHLELARVAWNHRVVLMHEPNGYPVDNA